MMGTATAALFGFSSAPCPPTLKMPTLYPVRPRLRVGMASCDRGLLGMGQVFVSARPCAAPVSTAAAAAAVLPLRNARRSGLAGRSNGLAIRAPPLDATVRSTTGGPARGPATAPHAAGPK